ncbi:MAG: 23S rRNA (guanosine(2251)-2'-O)-methyltransferase RlmB [Deltaproteobacteria bacterium]|nr:23S rRNA (guanosine(2251)-2'-O)-methyltransferase RlmB [Deltaproteobacteria bacterium]MBW2121243.1 23S rRNA (guanosine(2251)-2'-O)-methyltransferase RlmB [Deltaproteobacteria bacterium]
MTGGPTPRTGMKQFIYGIHPVIESLKAPETRVREILIARSRKGQPEKIIDLAGQKRVAVRYVERRDLTTLAKTGAHQGVIGVIEGRDYASMEELLSRWRRSGVRALILVLDSIQDPQNLGALIRTANVLGAHGVVIPKKGAAGITPAVVKASAGATAFTPIARVTNIASTLERLKQEGIWIVGTSGEAGKPIFGEDMTMDLAVVIGSEARGIRRRVSDACDLAVSIPMAGEISSLNASVAAGIVLYEIIRQRSLGTPPHEPGERGGSK